MPNRVVLNKAEVRRTAMSLGQKSVRQVTRLTHSQAVENAPGGPYSAGVLKRSIGWQVRFMGTRVEGQSGSDLDYAWYVHQGTQPHRIRARTKPNLRFYWRKAGRTFTGPYVNHPGQKAQPFLTDALLAVAPRHGYKVVIYH